MFELSASWTFMVVVGVNRDGGTDFVILLVILVDTINIIVASQK